MNGKSLTNYNQTMKISIVLLFFCITTYAQKNGLIFFIDKIEGRPNAHIIDIKEGKDKSIYLLGECKDNTYKKTSSWYMHVDANGKKISAKHNDADVSNLKRFVLSKNENLLVVGNTESENGRSQSYTRLYDKEGNIKLLTVMAMSYPIILGDAINVDENQVLIAQSNDKVANGKYNVAILKTDIDRFLPMEIVSITSDFDEVPTKICLNSKKEMIVSCIRYNGESMSNIIYCINESGSKIWQYEPKVDNSFLNSSITIDKNDNTIFTCSYRNASTYLSSSVVLKLNPKGELVKEEVFDNIKSNGITILKNGNYLLYGANFEPYENRIIISKAAFRIIDPNFKIVLTDELGQTDSPNSTLPTNIVTEMPVSSEFNNAVQLSDGRLIFGGRVNYPARDENDVLTPIRQNQACVLFTSADGKFR